MFRKERSSSRPDAWRRAEDSDWLKEKIKESRRTRQSGRKALRRQQQILVSLGHRWAEGLCDRFGSVGGFLDEGRVPWTPSGIGAGNASVHSA